MAGGNNFAAACVAAGLQPRNAAAVFLEHAANCRHSATAPDLNQVKQAAFTTPVGHASGFQATEDGGFIVFVQSQLPVDQAAMNADLPQFTAALRRARESEAFQ